MRDIATELKHLRLLGMMGAWDELVTQGNSAGLQSARWLASGQRQRQRYTVHHRGKIQNHCRDLRRQQLFGQHPPRGGFTFICAASSNRHRHSLWRARWLDQSL